MGGKGQLRGSMEPPWGESGNVAGALHDDRVNRGIRMVSDGLSEEHDCDLLLGTAVWAGDGIVFF